MVKDRSERRFYRKSPGRQYGYEYDPLHSQSLAGAAVQSDSLDTRGEAASTPDRHTTGLLAPRPDPRRTRQLIRQNIIASKSKSGALDDTGQLDQELQNHYVSSYEDQELYENQVHTTHSSSRNPRSTQLPPSIPEQYGEPDEEYEEEPFGYDRLDPDLGYDYDEEEDYLPTRLTYNESPRGRSGGTRIQPEASEYGRRRSVPIPYDEDEEDEVPARSKKKKKG